MEHKKCSKCGELKNRAEDYYHTKTTGAVMAQCKACWKEFQKNKWHTDPTYKENQRDWIDNNRDRRAEIDKRARERAKQRLDNTK